ncbi:spermatogenesis-associated protein 17 [Engraulis encrasicolus]|uniref:spermatogenesis-associated protein 17 n=1 Tax=Engraulis encrasicolus TaxID=184585 RepID=UPI002FD3E748
MARLVKFQSQIQQVRVEFFERQRIAEENRKRENAAAVKIQSWIRGCRVRAYVRYLSRYAVIIQKIWRGYAAKGVLRHMQEVAYLAQRMRYYNQMATRIQKRWRGFFVRKYVHNYYDRKHYLEALAKKNEEVRRELEEHEEQQVKEREREALEREEQRKKKKAQRLHFLLSTQQRPGVFNSPFREGPSEMERRLRHMTPAVAQSANEASRRRRQQQRSTAREQQTLTLPPIHTKRPQGPFRGVEEVWRQRQRPIEPSLRVATSITALQEARQELRMHELDSRLVPHPFWPFSRAHKEGSKYDPLLHTRTDYQPLSYGTKHFRDDSTPQDKEPFKTVFTTCHVFDKFGRLYSNAGKIV